VVLIVEGFQVPLMPFSDFVGKDGGLLFRHCVAMAVKVGVTLLVIVTLTLADETLHPELLITVNPSVTEPEVPAVYLILEAVLPEVIVPPLMVHLYVSPLTEVDEAVLPAEPLQTEAAALIVALGEGLIVTSFFPDELLQPLLLVTVTESVTEPEAPDE
jgi:hypothetical protein